LNDEGIDIAQTGVTSLVPKSGFIFGQLLNLTVSNIEAKIKSQGTDGKEYWLL